MFQTEFGVKRASGTAQSGPSGRSEPSGQSDTDSPQPPTPRTALPTDVVGVVPLVWEEHCTECAYPTCYATCHLYRPRLDGHCARFENGIVAIDAGRAVRIGFGRWAKLEARIPHTPIVANPSRVRRAESVERATARAVASLPTKDLQRKALVRYGFKRSETIQGLGRKTTEIPHIVMFECVNPSPQSVRIVFEATGAQGHGVHRTSVLLAPGWSNNRFPVSALGIGASWWPERIMLYPDNDAEIQLDIIRLDLAYLENTDTAPGDSASSTSTRNVAVTPVSAPATKVKCLVFDLDNTLWEGVLVDDGEAGVRLRSEVRGLLEELDRRGILLSIASKNDADRAFPMLESLGLAEYFLYPQINWGPKSVSVRAIASALNIGVDSLAFIDDQPFERSEVTETVGAIRVYAETELAELLDRPEFDVPVTAESTQRRKLYTVEAERKSLLDGTGGDYDTFLSSCNITLNVFVPAPDQVLRCNELIQRTNQLNLTTRRLTDAEFEAILADPTMVVLAMSATDRFGTYGLIGVAIFDVGSSDGPVLTDFVTSCRVAQKAIEAGFFEWVRTNVSPGKQWLRATFLPTERNGLLRGILTEVGFEDDPTAGAPIAGAPTNEPGAIPLRLSQNTPVPRSHIVTVEGTLR